MKSLLITVLVTCIPTLHTFSQWIPFSGIPMDDIQCVRAYDAANFYAGLSNSIITSSDAGVNWQVKPVVDMSGNLLPSVITDVYFTSPTNAVAVGFISLGNSEAILHSTNGGDNWTIANLYNGGNYPRTQNTIAFPSALTGFTGGTNGRILRTYNGGTSWTTLSSGTTSNINDLYFTGTSTGYAACNGLILRTQNGNTWTQLLFPGKNFTGIHFPSGFVGYAVGESGVIYKTINAGSSWTPLDFPDPLVDFTSVYFVDDNVGYVTGDNCIYRTTSGGLYWEKVVKPADLNQVIFYSTTEGLACGDDGQVYHTSNSGETYKPQPYFSYSPSLSCYDSIVSFTNLSDPAWNYEWLLNGTVFSTAFSPSMVIPNSGNAVISLVAINGSERDTLSKNIFVEEQLQIDLVVNTPNQICQGQTAQVTVPNSEVGVSYTLRNGVAPIGLSQWGTGGTLTFNTGTMNASVTLNIRAVKSNACGTIEEVSNVNIVLQNPDINKIIYADPDTICVNAATSVFLELSENMASYQLMKGNMVIGSPQSGNGATLNFPTGNLTDTTAFFIRGISNGLGCITNFPALTVVVEDPVIYTAFSNNNPEIGESIEVFNNTVNLNGGFQWDFGPAATPQFSNSPAVPAVSFNTSGIVDVHLMVTTSTGCIKESVKQIHVINQFNEPFCSQVHYAYGYGQGMGGYGQLLSLTRDADRNIITICRNANEDSLEIYTGNGAMLIDSSPGILHYGERVTITKHNPKGTPMWSTNLRFDNTWAKCGDLVTDENNNIYAAYFHADHTDSLRIYSLDGRYITIDPPINGSSLQSIVIVKYDPNGMYLWHKTVLDIYTLDHISLKLDESNNVLVCGKYFYKIAPSGVVLESILYQDRADCEPDGQGGVYVIKGDDLGFEYVGPGSGIPFPVYTITQSNTQITTRYIKKDANNNYYLLGSFFGEFTYGGVTLSDPYSGGPSHRDLFLCKVNSDGTPGWIKQFKGSAETTLKGFDIQNGTIVFACKTYATNFQYMGGSGYNLTGNGDHFLFKCNTNGSSDILSLMFSEQIPFGTNPGLDLICLDSTGFKIDYGFEFGSNFNTPSMMPVNLHPDTNFFNEAIVSGDLSCVLNINAMSPFSSFNSDTTCVYTAVQFSDESTDYPTSWNWSFPGGTPASSNSENPVVSYPAPGFYTVELTASNQYGTGTTYSQSVYIGACLGTDEQELDQLAIATIEMGLKYRLLNSDPSSTMKLFNPEGREVAMEWDESKEINLEQQAPGVYLLKILYNHSIRTFKILKY